ncbi:hypothetical protein RJZ56_006855 [Blastomyces dermatitidis]|uniref:Wax synthase domain-containing protein n=1 Tax=Ajellomyces dermatitidis (strain ATCC 18188 / CBS 674.68) TaxID=653446 RepID=F2TNS6_AJEDA|nr:hypothetical protein BDDG_07834 [Blastomyces dermatitidis ATCC 18188]
MKLNIFIPYLAVAVAIALQGITLIYVPPNSYKRICMLPVILLPVAIVCLTAHHASYVQPWNIFIGLEFGTLLALEVLDNVCLSKISYPTGEAGDRKKHDGDKDTADTHAASTRNCFYDKVRWSLDIAINKRRINRADQTRNVPSFDSGRLHHIPSRRSFLLFRTARFILLYLVFDLITSQPLEDAQAKFGPGKDRIFARIMANDISPAEIGETVGILVGHCICAYISLLIGYDFFSLVAVGLCGAKVSDWKPLFGDIRQVYSIRTFWRRFWHQLLLRPLESGASFITHSVLGLPGLPTRNTSRITSTDESNGKASTAKTHLRLQDRLLLLVTAYTKLTLIFLISGLVHIDCDRILGIRFRDSRCISLFLSQAWGIMFEDAVRWIYRSVTGSKGDGPVKMWHRLVGYVWLVTFALWAGPGWAFSVVRLEVPAVVVPVIIFPRG